MFGKYSVEDLYIGEVTIPTLSLDCVPQYSTYLTILHKRRNGSYFDFESRRLCYEREILDKKGRLDKGFVCELEPLTNYYDVKGQKVTDSRAKWLGAVYTLSYKDKRQEQAK